MQAFLQSSALLFVVIMYHLILNVSFCYSITLKEIAYYIVNCGICSAPIHKH